ncbi:MAG: tRNA-dihydrouridine synthase family protein [Desulfohalobiaceae bacterium]|nr:tRNA-dihydrouridine synthase family protein [Desulfohalobiaceae bacterium]
MPPVAPDRPWLAPLAGFSDLPFRMLCRGYGAAVACTEMVSAKGLVYGGEGSWDLVRSTPRVPEDSPLVAQIFGAEVSFVREAVRRLLDLGARYFDLNAGCPVKKVVKTGAGAGLLEDSGRLAEILQAMVHLAGEGRVGVKIRSGWSGAEFVSGPAPARLEGIGLGWVTLHPRSAAQGLSGKANWSHLRVLRERIGVPLLASGDMYTAADGLACLDQGAADGIMYARGALSNPAVFRAHLRTLQGGGPGENEADQSERLEAARRHVSLCRHYADSRKNLLKMRTILPKYLKGFPGASAVRSRLVRVCSWDEVEALLGELAPDKAGQSGGAP